MCVCFLVTLPNDLMYVVAWTLRGRDDLQLEDV